MGINLINQLKSITGFLYYFFIHMLMKVLVHPGDLVEKLCHLDFKYKLLQVALSEFYLL